MKYFFLLSTFILLSFQVVNAQESSCSKNSDDVYNRNQVLKEMVGYVRESVKVFRPAYEMSYYTDEDKPVNFIVFDLTDPINNSVSGNKCVNFIDGHVYHFAPREFYYSMSSIAILNKGEIKFFSNINCGNTVGNLEEVLNYYKKEFKNSDNFQNTLLRIKNYRRYASWKSILSPFRCNIKPIISKNTDPSYNRYSIIDDLIGYLIDYNPKLHKMHGYTPLQEDERAIGFYIQDLVDLDNKQTSLLEYVDFIEGHVYQFGWIDDPEATTHFVALKEGKPHFFEAIDCKSEVDGLDELKSFIEKNFKNGKERKKIIKRTKNFKKYRILIRV